MMQPGLPKHDGWILRKISQEQVALENKVDCTAFSLLDSEDTQRYFEYILVFTLSPSGQLDSREGSTAKWQAYLKITT